MREFDIVIYGSYGYTGQLIVEHLITSNEKILLAGRDRDKLAEQSQASGFPFEAVDIRNAEALKQLMAKATLVLHCAGPFHATAKQMVTACLQTQTHYIDITGEYAIFEMLAGFDGAAKDAGIVIMPGAGFDIVPTDCLALHLKNKLPDATHLQLAFAMSGGGLSRGTARTMIDGLGYGGMIRKNGSLQSIALGSKTMNVRFCNGIRKTMCIPWGDISTAWRTTGIPNIEVYTTVSSATIFSTRLLPALNWLLRMPAVKSFLRKNIDARRPGPSDMQREKGKSFLWGRVTNAAGKSIEARFRTSSGYTLTAQISSLIAKKLVAAQPTPGYFTPAMYFGEDFIFEMEGTAWC